MATFVWPSTPVVKCSVAARGDGGVALDDPGDDAAERLDAERERRYVEQQKIVGCRVFLAGKDLRLHGRSQRDDLVGVELGVELLAARFEIEELRDECAHGGDAGGAADHDDFVDRLGGELGVFEGLANGAGGAFDDSGDELFELLARDLAIVGLAADFDRYFGVFRGTKCDFGVDYGLTERLDHFGLRADVDAEVAADVVDRDGDEEVVDVIAAEVGVAAGGDDLEDALVQLEDGDVEGAAAEVVDGDDAVFAAVELVEAIRERGGGGLVYETKDVEAGDAARVLGGLALRVVEVGGNGDDGLGDRRAEEAFGVFLELQQDVRGDLGRREREAADVELQHLARLETFRELKGEEFEFGFDVPDVAAHEPLDGVDRVFGVMQEDVAGGVADGPALVGTGVGGVVVEGNDGGHDGRAVLAGDDRGCVALHVGDERVGGAKVDADDACCSAALGTAVLDVDQIRHRFRSAAR